MNNKERGNSFEQEFCQILKNNNFFAYNLPNKASGQPFDIIATKDNQFFAFECKTVKGDKFLLTRIEDNQAQAFKSLNKAKSEFYYLVAKFDNEIKAIRFQEVIHKIYKGCNFIRKDEFKELKL